MSVAETKEVMYEPDTVTPRGARLLVRRAAKEERSGALFLADEAKEKARHGKVIAVGPDVTEPELQPGAHVVFGAFAGNEVRFSIRHSDEIVILKKDDILGTLPS